MVLSNSESTYLADIPDFKNYFLMNFSKQDYESPTTAVLELRVEGFICQSIPGSTINPFENDGDPITF